MNIFEVIKQKIDILTVISEHLTLRKNGSYYKGKCPFHNERTASFTVSPDKEIFYCFGCHVGGDVITFISKMEHCTLIEAAKIIQERYNIDVPNFNLDNLNKKKEYINANQVFLDWTKDNLNKYFSNSLGDYLNSRGINKESLEKFNIGFMPGGQNFIKDLINFARKKNILTSDFIDLKILFKNKSNLYSPYEDRIIFPIYDHLSNLVGFGGRIFKEDDKRVKYYNSHESKFFNKGSLLFGLNLAKKNLNKKNALFLVEGYIDNILMVQNRFENTVATLGTACTREHLSLISKYTDRLYLIYDQDTAGQNAINRLLEYCFEYSLDIYIISLPKGEDPASFLAKNLDLKPLILKAKDIFNFYILNLDLNLGLTEKLKEIEKIIGFIKNIKDNLKKDLLLKQISKTFDLSEKALKSRLANQENINIENKDINIDKFEKKIISAVFYFKEDFQKLKNEDKEALISFLTDPLKDLLVKLIENKSLNEQEKSLISKIVIEANSDSSFEEIMSAFYKKRWKLLLNDLKSKINKAEKDCNKDLINKLLNDLELLKKNILKGT